MEGAPNLRRQGFHPQRPWELGSCVSVRLAFGGGGYRLPRYSENCGPDGEARSQGLEAGAWRAEAGLPRTWGTDRAVQTCFCTQDFGVTGTRPVCSGEPGYPTLSGFRWWLPAVPC